MTASPGRATISRSRLIVGYAILGVVTAAALGGALIQGSGLPENRSSSGEASRPVLGRYDIRESPACFADPQDDAGFVLDRSGTEYRLQVGDSTFPASVRDGRLEATIDCPTGLSAELTVDVIPHSSGSTLVGTLNGSAIVAASHELSGEETFGRLMLAIAVAILVARALGAIVSRLGQPRVMGEVIGGILLGPSLFGMLVPNIQSFIFPPSITPLLGGAANIGLAFYMFLIGLELDPALLRGRLAQAAFISNASVLVPMAAGAVLALALYSTFGMLSFVPFALFMGVAMSITAFPVLARILTERRMVRRPVGAMALSAAAVDDVSAWTLLALASAAAMSGHGSALDVALVLALTGVLAVFMFLVARPFLRRIAVAYGEVGYLPPIWLAVVFVGVLLAAYAASEIGVAAIFGAFLMGIVMPRRADLTRDLTQRIEPFVVTVLLPLFFVVTGLRTEIGLLDTPGLWLTALGIIGVAVLAKWGSAMASARYLGWEWRPAAAIGALMNTRGLTELIVLNIGRDLGVLSPSLFAMMVVMALVTTLMTGPSMRLIDPRRSLSEAPGEELRAAIEESPGTDERAARSSHSVLVAAQDPKNFDSLLGISLPASRLGHQREILLALLLPPASLSTGVRADADRLLNGTREVQVRHQALLDQGIPARAVAYVSPDFGADLVRLTTTHDVDLVVIDGQRPILGDPLPRGPIQKVLADAACDVAVVIARHDDAPEPAGPVVVPFSGDDHDWAALELATVVAKATNVGVRLVGASQSDADSAKVTRLLTSASIAVQKLSGVAVETQIVEPGAAGVLAAASGGSLLMVGLSISWREEGIGEVRQFIAQHAGMPTVLVRSGGARSFLRAESSATQVAWSRSN